MSRALSSQSIDNSSLPPTVVINTRPLERAAPLTERLQAAGLTVVDMPMLTLQSRAVSDTDIELMRDWLAIMKHLLSSVLLQQHQDWQYGKLLNKQKNRLIMVSCQSQICLVSTKHQVI